MVSANLPTVKFNCSGCGAHYEVPESMAGRSGPCAKCGAQVTVPARAAAANLLAELDEPASSTPYFRSPQYVGVDCHVCQTRLYGTPDQVGQELKCPDCGTKTVLRPPPPQAAAKQPEAMEGDQYELMDDEPSKAAVAAQAVPTYVAFNCKLCDTLMHATADRVGQSIACPDCGRKNVVPPPPKPHVAASVLTSDGEDYLIDPAADPGERPPVIIPPRGLMQYEIAEAAALADMSPAAVQRRSRLDAHGRPIMPRQPLTTGVFRIFWSVDMLGWWIALSAGYVAVVLMFMDAVAGAAIGGQVAFVALFAWLFGMVAGGLLTAVASACWLSIVVDSTDGHDEVQNWQTRHFSDWFPPLLNFVCAVSMSTTPGVLLSIGIGQLIPTNIWSHVAIAYVTTVAIFPLVVLSQLDNDSAFGVFSGRIFGTLARCTGSWMLFYIETALMLGACVGAAAACAILNVLPLVPVPLYVAAFLLYARLLGRLGWRLAEATAAVE